MNAGCDMTAGDAALAAEDDELLAEFQGQLNLIFARARSLWRESAARVHPDLSPSGYKLLAFIGHAENANAHRIADRFDMDKSAISRHVRILEDLGLIESRPDEQDGRLRVLTATPEARERLSAIRAGNGHRMQEIFAGLTRDEIRTASKVFRLLAEA